jgi:predicted transposase YdaD
MFQRVRGHPLNAASQLRSVLPAGVLPQLDLGQLTLVPGSFVDEELCWRHTDLLFSVPVADGSERQAFLYVLIEHQSSSDPLMPFRILRYMVRIWDQWLDEHRGAKKLPAVIPLVVHHHRSPWNEPTELSELLDLDAEATAAAAEYLPRLRFLLDDLARVDEKALRSRPLTPPARMALVLLKVAAGNQRLGAELRMWDDELRAVLDRPGGMEDFVALLSYIERVGETPAEELHELFAQLGSQAEEAYVTTAEMLRTEGRVEGRAQGRAEGRTEGELRGRAESLVQLLILKFGPLPADTLQLVHAATVDQLETWTARVLTAETLGEVLP